MISLRLGASGEVRGLYLWDTCTAYWVLLSLYTAKYSVGVEYILNINNPHSKYQAKPRDSSVRNLCKAKPERGNA